MVSKSEILQSEDETVEEVLNYPFSTLVPNEIINILYEKHSNKPSLIAKIISGFNMKDFQLKIKNIIKK